METYDDIFTTYYTLYRGDSDVPASTDDEYTIGLRFANQAITRWANYDNTYWNELFTTLVAADDGDKSIVSGQTEYTCPTDMKKPGGAIKIIDSNGLTAMTYPILNPEDAQFMTDSSQYVFFTGDPINGFVMNLSTAPDDSIVGMDINYVYYKKPTLFSTGSDNTEMSDPYFIVNYMLANRYRVSRNPYYNSALRDAEDILKTMKSNNNSGTWANPWSVADRSGTNWGA